MKNNIQCRMGMVLLATLLIVSCKSKEKTRAESSNDIPELKRGDLISCGPADQQFGKLNFELSSGKGMQAEFNLGVKMLHSFEYDEAEKVFANIIDKDPQCAMAYWGVAMANFHALWTPPTEAELKKGSKAVEIARTVPGSSDKEKEYINAVAAFFTGWENTDHRSRTLNFEKAMEGIYTKYPDDHEAAIFYALAMNAAADPADKTFSRQKKAGVILNSLYAKFPDHPGIVHYIIHTYDSPEMASQALEAARRYASIAPSSAHALHMPSHIFTRLGLWQESINSNLQSVSSARCYAESSNLPGHWDEELHGLDYLTYAYLQSGQTDSAKKQWDYLYSFKAVSPVNFKVAYAFAAVPSRYLLENKLWSQAAILNPGNEIVSWNKYPWQNAILHFTRALGNIHSGNLGAAKTQIAGMKSILDTLLNQKDSYKANQVLIQINSAEAWTKFYEGKKEAALSQMMLAADMEDKTEKHPVTPCEVIPARQLLADMLFEMKEYAKAGQAYEQDLAKHPNRLNSLLGAAESAEKANNRANAGKYYRQLISIASAGAANNNAVIKANQFLARLDPS